MVQTRSQTNKKTDEEEIGEKNDLTGDATSPAHLRPSSLASMMPKDDRSNILLLLLLYILQGIPLGLSAAIPMLLANYHIKYHEQAIFSFAFWPFSVKLLWAPIVDSVWIGAIGRRKSWVIPSQLLIGFTMLMMSSSIADQMKPDKGGHVDIFHLTCLFTFLNFLAATQDIGVDAWALTMLKPSNIGWASTCNSVGQTAGFFIGNVVFLAFESKDFCNNWLRSIPEETGILTLDTFLLYAGVTFIIVSFLVQIFKAERDDGFAAEGVVETYRLCWRIISDTAVLKFIPILLTCKIGFAAVDGVTALKLVEAGMPKDRLAMLSIPITPLQIILPFVISRYTSGPNPLLVWIRPYPMRLIVGIAFPTVVYLTEVLRNDQNEFPYWYYAVLLSVYALSQVVLYTMFVSIMAFHAKISDPKIGGTYMTLLNTITNLGGNWPVTVVLWFVDDMTLSRCNGGALRFGGCPAANDAAAATCKSCEVAFDGYYTLVAITTVMGIVWYRVMRPYINSLNRLPLERWRVSTT